MGKEALMIGADTFQFFTRNPRGSSVKNFDEADALALNTFMKEHAFAAGPVLISHCLNSELALRLKALIQENWPAAEVEIMPTRGLCSFYAEKGGMIIAY